MRRSLLKSIVVGLSLIHAATLAGCAAFPADTLKNAKVPDVSAYKNKPKVYVEVKFFQGEPGYGRAVQMQWIPSQALQPIENEIRASGLFETYTFDAFEQGKVDQIIRLHYYNYGSSGGAFVMGLLCGFTFGVIPAVSTDRYAVVAEAVPRGAKEGTVVRSNDAVTTWMGIWFIPVSGKTVNKAVEQTMRELTRDALRKLVTDKKIQLSEQLPAPLAPMYYVVPAPIV